MEKENEKLLQKSSRMTLSRGLRLLRPSQERPPRVLQTDF